MQVQSKTHSLLRKNMEAMRRTVDGASYSVRLSCFMLSAALDSTCRIAFSSVRRSRLIRAGSCSSCRASAVLARS
jgi:hypothetical protein